MTDPVELLVWFYGQRGGSENLIKEANSDAGLTAHPSSRFETNRNYFQLAMLAYNLNCWLMLFNREEGTSSETLRHTTPQTARLRFLFLAAKIWRHAGRVEVSYWSIRLSEESFPNDGIHHYSDHSEEKNILQRLMDRVRSIAAGRRWLSARAENRSDRAPGNAMETGLHKNLCAFAKFMNRRQFSQPARHFRLCLSLAGKGESGSNGPG
jgi:hypothetical protein